MDNIKTILKAAVTTLMLAIFIRMSAQIGGEIPEKYPVTPSMEWLNSQKPFEAELIMRVPKSKSQFKDLYYKDQRLFTGWALKIFENDVHRYRYSQYKNGLLCWQIEYYDTGKLSHDFRMKDGKGFGSARMWFENGDPYIHTYCIEPGVQDGKQYRWAQGNVLLYEALYDHGTKIYEKEFDRNGKEIKAGTIPKPPKEEEKLTPFMFSPIK